MEVLPNIVITMVPYCVPDVIRKAKKLVMENRKNIVHIKNKAKKIEDCSNIITVKELLKV